MEFSHSSLLQMLLGSCNVCTSGDISDDLLASPTTIEDPGLGIAETPFEVDDGAGICALSAEIVGVLKVKLVICSAWELIRNSLRDLGGEVT
jgi:hypothetical protein